MAKSEKDAAEQQQHDESQKDVKAMPEMSVSDLYGIPMLDISGESDVGFQTDLT